MVELIKEFPLSDIGGQMMEEKIRKVAYTKQEVNIMICLLYTSPSPRDATLSRMPSSA